MQQVPLQNICLLCEWHSGRTASQRYSDPRVALGFGEIEEIFVED
jgi:hypothetical protein